MNHVKQFNLAKDTDVKEYEGIINDDSLDSQVVHIFDYKDKCYILLQWSEIEGEEKEGGLPPDGVSDAMGGSE